MISSGKGGWLDGFSPCSRRLIGSAMLITAAKANQKKAHELYNVVNELRRETRAAGWVAGAAGWLWQFRQQH